MYNIIHFASTRGMRDTSPRRPRPTVQPAGASHFTLIEGDRAEAPRKSSRQSGDAVPQPPAASPSSG